MGRHTRILKAGVVVLWESGRGILEGSLEEVGFKGLDLESKVCTCPAQGSAAPDQRLADGAAWRADWGPGSEA